MKTKVMFENAVFKKVLLASSLQVLALGASHAQQALPKQAVATQAVATQAAAAQSSATTPAKFAAAKPSKAGEAAPSALNRNEPLGCLIEPSVVVEVGSPVMGLIERVQAERGDYVRKGQALVQLDARVERASVALALARFENEADSRSAKSSHDFALKKAERTDSLYKQEIVSIQAKEQADTEAKVALSKLEQTTEARSQYAKEVQLARAQLSQRTIVSPVSGVVVERYLSAGERVDDKPMMKVAQIDPLRVEVILPASMYGRFKTGSTLSVTPDMPGSNPVDAKVQIVDRVIDAASSTFRVRLELPNRNGALPSGLRCKVNLGV